VTEKDAMKPTRPRRGLTAAGVAVAISLGAMLIATTGARTAPNGHRPFAVGVRIRPTGSAVAPARSPARPHAYRVVLTYSGDEYEDAQYNVLNDTNGTCPPSHNIPSVKAKCWTWKAKHLGHGTFAVVFNKLEGLNNTWTFTYTDSHGDTLTGNGHAVLNPDPTPPHEPGHVNRWVTETERFTGGTGRFAGVNGVLEGTATTVVASDDPATGVVHKKVTNKEVGTLTFPSKL
jgi:hypothetical protein